MQYIQEYILFPSFLLIKWSYIVATLLAFTYSMNVIWLGVATDLGGGVVNVLWQNV